MPHWRTVFGRERVRISTDPDPDAAQPAEQVVETQQEDPAPSLPIKGRTPSGRIPAKMRNDELVKQFYKRYQLKWPKLREWLVDKFPEDEFPGVEFKQKFDATKEYYEFYVPRKLTKEEHEEIEKLREDA